MEERTAGWGEAGRVLGWRVSGFGVCGDREEQSMEETSDLILGEVMVGRTEHEGFAFLPSVTLTLACLSPFFRRFTTWAGSQPRKHAVKDVHPLRSGIR